VQIYINRNGQQLGPFDENAVLQMLNGGQLSPNDLGIRHGESQWQPLGKLFPEINRMPGIAANPPNVQNNLQTPVPPKKSAASKGCIFSLLGFGVLLFIAVAGLFGYFLINKKKSLSNVPTANKSTNSNNSTNSAPQDYSAMKTKAEELARLSPPVKLDSKAKLNGKIAIVEKGKYDAEMKGFDVLFKEINETDLSFYNLTKERMAKTPEEIDSLVQILCTKGKMIGKYEGNIIGYANNCKVSMIDYRKNVVFAQKTLINSTPEKSISSVYDKSGEYVVIPPISEISEYVKTFVPEKTEVSTSDPSMLPVIEDPKTFARSAGKFGRLSFPLKPDENAVIKGKITIIQADEYGESSAMMIGLDREGNVEPPLPNSIILTKESLGFTNEQIARKTSEIDTLIQVNCKKGSLITKVKGISVFSNSCTVSVVDYKAFATIAQKTFEGKKVDNNRYSDPSMYEDKQDTVEFPRKEIEEYIKAFPKA
jgi:hypothetical protein